MPRYVAAGHGLGRLANGTVGDHRSHASRGGPAARAGITPEELAEMPVLQSIPDTDVRLCSPVCRLAKVWTVRFADAEHSAEVGREQDEDEVPFLFLTAKMASVGPVMDIKPALCPGDVVLTGTPAGVGHPFGRFLAAGDLVRVEVQGVGVIENIVCMA
jgi:2-keto-4-pentenoate hydratase/2-oxohepta-3-ene-1,7-dioic acid hydratase in catechol pathway